MTRICLLVEVEWTTTHTPEKVRDHLEEVIKTYSFLGCNNPTVELTAFEPTEAEVEVESEDMGGEVSFNLQIYKITTSASNYEIMMNDDGSGTITRIGGSSPYVPPDVSSRPWDGESFTFTNGRFSDRSPDGSYQGGESFWCDSCELLYHTGWITKKEQVA